MSEKNQKAAQVIEYGKNPTLQDAPIPKPQQGELLIKI